MRILLSLLLIALSAPALAQPVLFGFRIQDLTPVRAIALGADVTGAEIVEIKPGSLADGAGFAAQDIVMVFGSTTVTSAQMLADQVRIALDRGGDYPFQFWRSGETQSISVNFGPCLHGEWDDDMPKPALPENSPFQGLFPDQLICNPAPAQ